MASGTSYAEHLELDLLVPGSLTSSPPLGQPFASSPQTPEGPQSRQQLPTRAQRQRQPRPGHLSPSNKESPFWQAG